MSSNTINKASRGGSADITRKSTEVQMTGRASRGRSADIIKSTDEVQITGASRGGSAGITRKSTEIQMTSKTTSLRNVETHGPPQNVKSVHMDPSITDRKMSGNLSVQSVKQDNKPSGSEPQNNSNDNSRTQTEVDYLKKNLGPILVAALAEICIRRPTDPIEYLGHWLLRWRYNEELKRKDLKHAIDVLKERQPEGKEAEEAAAETEEGQAGRAANGPYDETELVYKEEYQNYQEGSTYNDVVTSSYGQPTANTENGQADTPYATVPNSVVELNKQIQQEPLLVESENEMVSDQETENVGQDERTNEATLEQLKDTPRPSEHGNGMRNYDQEESLLDKPTESDTVVEE